MTIRPVLLLTLALLLTACGSGVEAQVVAAPAIDLSGETNVRALQAAESGALGRPTIVFFHARWCHICRKARPAMDELAAQHENEIAIVRMDIDEPAARVAVDRYRVSATPTFLLLAADGNVLATIPGWPGKENMELTIEQLLQTR